jgi:hypothetical protein
VNTVSLPWPISVEAASTSTRPSARVRTPVTEARWSSPLPVKPQPCMNTEKPTPFLMGPGPALCRRRPPLVPVAQIGQGPVHEALQVQVLGDPLAGGHEVAQLQQVLPAQLDRVQAQLRAAADVHVALHGEQALGRAEAAERAVGRGVGGHRPGMMRTWGQR